MELNVAWGKAWWRRHWQWHRWFAWYPIMYTGFANPPEHREKIVWLQWVERRIHSQSGRKKTWIYRSTEDWTGKKADR